VEVGYNRRMWGNFFFTDNQAIGPADFNQATITAPRHPELPGGGGYPVTFNVRNARSPLGATNNYQTAASDFGNTTMYWQGVDVNINARMRNGLVFQGGTSSGAGVQDLCDITAALPELLTPAFPFAARQVNSCKVNEPWLTTFRGLVSYTVPRIDVLLSASIRSQANVAAATTANDFITGLPLTATNGNSLDANYNVFGFQVPLAPGVPFQEEPSLRPHADQRRPRLV
jgi:hypothetical protein